MTKAPRRGKLYPFFTLAWQVAPVRLTQERW
jgi:hypothetical protein